MLNSLKPHVMVVCVFTQHANFHLENPLSISVIINHLCKETHLYIINVKDKDKISGLQSRNFMYIYYHFH